MLTVVQTHSVSCCIGVLEKGVQDQLRGTGIDEWPSSNLEAQTTKSLACRGEPCSLEEERRTEGGREGGREGEREAVEDDEDMTETL